MCVWSAYTGKRDAAPILWESLKKIEGFWGGYYTGLVTGDQNGLHHGKVLGNMEVWQENFDLAGFSGTCGLIHSRTDSGGDERWGHPFIGCAGKVALISQGCNGIFSDRANPVLEDWGNRMLQNGKSFPSAIYGQAGRYPVLADGGQVHCGDVGAQVVEYYYEKWGDPLKAVRHVFSDITIEDATLFLFADRPGVIVFANANQHLVYQKTADGTYLSISAIGLPGNCGMELPCNSIGIITPDEIRIEALHERYETDMTIPAGTLSAALEFIKANPGKLTGHMADGALKGLFPRGSLNYRVGAAYRCIETLIAEEKIRVEKVQTVGSQGTPGTAFRLYAAE